MYPIKISSTIRPISLNFKNHCTKINILIRFLLLPNYLQYLKALKSLKVRKNN